MQVGQVWKDRLGRRWQITDINMGGLYSTHAALLPENKVSIRARKDGREFYDRESVNDLIEKDD
jgi:hypothetical protein